MLAGSGSSTQYFEYGIAICRRKLVQHHLTFSIIDKQTKGLDISKVIITHANANQAPKMRRRTYRAHGRINGKYLRASPTFIINAYSLIQFLFQHCSAYMSCPAHIELIAEERNDEIVKEKDVSVVKQSKKQVAQSRAKQIKIGGGVTK